MTKKVGVILADGFEEIEAVTVVDILRRAELEVVIYGLDKEIITGSRGVKIVTDRKMLEFEQDLDALVFPGGMPGAKNLADSEKVNEWIQKMTAQKKIIAAICASPAVVLAPLGVLEGKKTTCYPGMEGSFSEKTTYLQEDVVVDENIITSRGPATALRFSLALVEKLTCKETTETLRKKVLA